MTHDIECGRPCTYAGFKICKSPGWRCNTIDTGCLFEQKSHRCPTCEERYEKYMALPPIRVSCVCGEFIETHESQHTLIWGFMDAHCDHVSPTRSGYHEFPATREGRRLCFFATKGPGSEASDGIPNPSANPPEEP